MSLLNDFAQGLTHLLFPRVCEGCHHALMKQEEVLCLACLATLPRTGYHVIQDNEAALRLAGRIPYQHVTALAYFSPDSLVQHLLHRLKYDNRKEIGLFLGRQLGYELLKSNWAQQIDYIIPVPLHPKKEAARSYNQSMLIATGIAEITGKEASAGFLKRVRYTESQTKKTRADRMLNVQDVFAAAPSPALPHKHVLLIDDVLTTGATLEAAAGALLKVPGIKISIAAAALAES